MRQRQRVTNTVNGNIPIGKYKRVRNYDGRVISNETMWTNPGLRYPLLESEYCYDELHSGPPWKTGGPFNKWETRNEYNTIKGDAEISVPYYNGYYTDTYTGGFLPLVRLQDYHSMSPTSFVGYNEDSLAWGDVASYGTEAWNKYKPGQAQADLAVFVAELSDLPRMLKSTCRGFVDIYKATKSSFGGNAKKAADHYLNTQFGWLPFLSDLRKFHQTWRNLDRLLTQLIRDNGHWIKRSGTVNKESNSELLEEGSTSAHSPSLPSQFFSGLPSTGSYRLSLKYTQNVWFSGRFRYWIPNHKGVLWRANAIRRLYGASLTPDVVWNIIPFSWLVDWFGNWSDYFKSLDNGLADNLVAKYAYVMGTTNEVITLDSELTTNGGNFNASWESSLERKSRTEANPFGFGAAGGELTTRRTSILAALGVSRLKLK